MLEEFLGSDPANISNRFCFFQNQTVPVRTAHSHERSVSKVAALVLDQCQHFTPQNLKTPCVSQQNIKTDKVTPGLISKILGFDVKKWPLIGWEHLMGQFLA